MTKKPFTEIETIITNRIAELETEYDLDRYDIAEIREEAYKANGWGCDPFPEEEEEERDEEEETYTFRSFEDQLREVGMSLRDFI
jgi:hypothetical protein